MSRIVVPYADFSGGDYGRAEAWNAPKGSFSALNMYVTKAGELTVRGGLRNCTPTSTPAEVATYLGEYAQGTTGGFKPYVFYGSTGAGPTTNFHYFSPQDPATLINSGSIGNVPINDHFSVPASSYFVTKAGAGTGATLNANPSPAAYAGSIGAKSVALYLNRLVVAPGDNTLRWSDINATTGAPNFASWTATNTVSVGTSDTAIIAIRTQRSHLVVMKPEGIFVITGDMAVATVRQVSTTFGPISPQATHLSRDETLWYIPSLGGTIWQFNGARSLEFNRFPIGVPASPVSSPLTVAVGGLPTEDRGVFVLDNDIQDSMTVSLGWLYLNGVWTKHTFPVALQPYIAPVTATVLTDPSLPAAVNETFWRSTRQVSSLVFVDKSATPKFYALTLSDRPGTESTPPFSPNLLMPERAGDDSTAQVTGSVTFPEWHSQAGEDAIVKTVIVDYRAFNTGGSLTNRFDVTVSALRLYDAEGSLGSATLSYDEAGASVAAGGTLGRQVFSFGDQGAGNGFQIFLTNVRGVAIQRVTVIVDTQTTRGMS